MMGIIASFYRRYGWASSAETNTSMRRRRSLLVIPCYRVRCDFSARTNAVCRCFRFAGLHGNHTKTSPSLDVIASISNVAGARQIRKNEHGEIEE